MRRCKMRALPRRRGAVVVITAVTIVVLLLCASLCVDLGHVHAVAAEMQNTADAAALAGAGATLEGVQESAESVALDFIARNQKTQGFLSLDDQVIEVGKWYSPTHTFEPLDDITGATAFAVRVVSYRNETPYFFASIIGKDSTDVYREAVAVGSGPCTGIWGLQGVRAGAITTDSYDSTTGAYSDLTAGNEGDICSGRDVDMNGSFDVHGDVMAGFGYDVYVKGKSGYITGMTTAKMDEIIWPPIPIPVTNDNDTITMTDSNKSPWKTNKPGANLDIQAGDNVTLAPGTYVLDSITIAGGGTITVTGPTTIYVLQNIDATGGSIINETTDPHDLSIISTTTDYLKLGGGNAFYGSILAPWGKVELGGNDNGYFGALVAQFVEMKGDIEVHVDESLPLAGEIFETPPPFLVR